jgi:hypothetical protein
MPSITCMNLTREAASGNELGGKKKPKKRWGRTELIGDCNGTLPVDHGGTEKRNEGLEKRGREKERVGVRRKTGNSIKRS